MIVILVSALVAVSCLMLVWAIGAIRDIQAKDSFVADFVRVSLEFLEHPEFDDFLKAYLVEIAPYIESRSLANAIAAFDPSRDGSHAVDTDLVAKLRSPGERPTEERIRFLVAIYYFVMGLSYSSRKGSRLRRRLSRELSDPDALLNEGAKVYLSTMPGNGPSALRAVRV
jgi:hypothetical protein